MKVRQALLLLKNYDPDDEIIVEWWDADCFQLVDENGCDVPLVPREVWNAFASKERMDTSLMGQVHQQIGSDLQDYFWELLREVK